MSTQPKKDNKNYVTFEHYEEDSMYRWIKENLEKFWEINIERFPAGGTIVKFRWTQEAEEAHMALKKAAPAEEDDL